MCKSRFWPLDLWADAQKPKFSWWAVLGGLIFLSDIERKKDAEVQASLLPWPTRPPAPTNLFFFNLSGAVPASCRGPNLDHGGSRLQGACP